MLKEFPFLHKINVVDEKDPAYLDIRVRRWTPELVAIVPDRSGHRSTSVGNRTDADLFFAIEQDGGLYELETSGYWTDGRQTEPDRHYHARTILEQIADAVDTLAFLVRVEYGVCDWQETDPITYVTIYKPAKDMSLAELVSKAREKAQRELESEMAF